MKKATILVIVLFSLSLILAAFLFAEGKDDFQAIKKAVKKNPNYQAGKEVKWFKLLVRDNKTDKDKVRLTLPVSLVELFVKHVKKSRVSIDDECEVDVRALFNELKELGPTSIIEIYEEEATVRIWLE
ncbi:MAG: hypothetical protein ACETWK_01335 [Candidatus Aminicenantaceae bacterium]